MMLGIMVGISSEAWLGAWFGMEMNSYFFLPLVKKSEFQFKYYLMQALGSVFFIYSFYHSSNFLYITGLIMKIGVSPFFFWIYPSFKWIPNKPLMMFMTLQKILPLYLLINMTLNFSDMILLLIFFFCNAITGYLGVKNKTLMIDIVLFSSIYQMSWVILSLIMSKYMFKFYFMYYIMIVFFSMVAMKKDFLSRNDKSSFIIMWFIFFLISGFPPSIIFLMKIHIIMNVSIIFSHIMILFNLMLVIGFMINYLKLIYSSIHNKKVVFMWKKADIKFNIFIFLPFIITILMM
uniref:NADH-ubiquinone oxidoreductase chain 2 n=1 Tax=Liposcelis decolor TaxID=209926 RepID=X2BZU7_9NEOP|nr:NADH dehydrogenase subunit 2 [Liposcelis decolor]AFV61890.1 NADH dehydrogenase subunit 2 [Liposcelis decolor]